MIRKRSGAPFTETLIRLRREETGAEAIAAGSPNGLVPVLKDGDVTVWDSLAICEYLAERFPAAKLWPADAAARAMARAAAAEMHAGFAGETQQFYLRRGGLPEGFQVRERIPGGDDAQPLAGGGQSLEQRGDALVLEFARRG